jgi:hypothetical protein
MTERVHGALHDGEELMYAGEVWLETTERRGVKSWDGGFETDAFPFTVHEHPLKLRLADGRAGQVYITNIVISSENTHVTFAGSGPLA